MIISVREQEILLTLLTAADLLGTGNQDLPFHLYILESILRKCCPPEKSFFGREVRGFDEDEWEDFFDDNDAEE